MYIATDQKPSFESALRHFENSSNKTRISRYGIRHMALNDVELGAVWT